jgi:hypothetical protein
VRSLFAACVGLSFRRIIAVLENGKRYDQTPLDLSGMERKLALVTAVALMLLSLSFSLVRGQEVIADEVLNLQGDLHVGKWDVSLTEGTNVSIAISVKTGEPIYFTIWSSNDPARYGKTGVMSVVRISVPKMVRDGFYSLLLFWASLDFSFVLDFSEITNLPEPAEQGKNGIKTIFGQFGKTHTRYSSSYLKSLLFIFEREKQTIT